MRRIRKIMLILTILMASVTVMAQTAEPVIGIVLTAEYFGVWPSTMRLLMPMARHL